jgi:hypothetical protein
MISGEYILAPDWTPEISLFLFKEVDWMQTEASHSNAVSVKSH